MSNGEHPAYPIESAINAGDSAAFGLTKREAFAMAAIQGICGREYYMTPEEAAEIAIKTADALLKALEQ